MGCAEQRERSEYPAQVAAPRPGWHGQGLHRAEALDRDAVAASRVELRDGRRGPNGLVQARRRSVDPTAGPELVGGVDEQLHVGVLVGPGPIDDETIAAHRPWPVDATHAVTDREGSDTGEVVAFAAPDRSVLADESLTRSRLLDTAEPGVVRQHDENASRDDAGPHERLPDAADDDPAGGGSRGCPNEWCANRDATRRIRPPVHATIDSRRRLAVDPWGVTDQEGDEVARLEVADVDAPGEPVAFTV